MMFEGISLKKMVLGKSDCMQMVQMLNTRNDTDSLRFTYI